MKCEVCEQEKHCISIDVEWTLLSFVCQECWEKECEEYYNYSSSEGANNMSYNIEKKEIEKIIRQLERGRDMSLNDSFNDGIEFALRRIGSLLYDREHVKERWGEDKDDF